MNGIPGKLQQFCRKTHTILHSSSVGGGGPTEMLRKKVNDLEKKKKIKNPLKDRVFVEVPESRSYLDTATMPIILTAVAVAFFTKLLMMHDESKSQEMIERKIKNAPPGQGNVRMLTREEWEEIQEVRPRTPFESKFARADARVRTEEPLHWEDMKDWTVDVLTDALTRAEESARSGPN